MTRTQRTWLRWLVAYVLVTLVADQVTLLPELRVAHGVLIYLMLIVGASREGGWQLATVMVVLGYLGVDYYFVPPRRAFGAPSQFDFVILVGFVVTSAVIARLVIRLRATAALASERADAIEAMSEERVRLARLAASAEVLQNAERLKDALLASVSHDLRSPVMSMMMLTDPATGIAPADALRRIQQQAERLAGFLSTLDRFQAARGGEARVQVAEHSARDLVQTLLSAMQLTLGDRPVAIVQDDDTPLMVRCDFTLTLHVLGNLVQNAILYSPAASPLVFTIEPIGDTMVRIRLSDRGDGVPPEEAEAIFSPLRRGAEAMGRGDGTGMGLAIARTFARAQGGDVAYAARAGGGSHFDLTLPVAAPLTPPVRLNASGDLQFALR